MDFFGVWVTGSPPKLDPNKPKWLTVTMPLLETIERLERDKTETRER